MEDIDEKIKNKMEEAKGTASKLYEATKIMEVLQKNAEGLMLLAPSDKDFEEAKKQYLATVIPKSEQNYIDTMKKIVGLDLRAQIDLIKTRMREKSLQIDRNMVCLNILQKELEKIGGNNANK